MFLWISGLARVGAPLTERNNLWARRAKNDAPELRPQVTMAASRGGETVEIAKQFEASSQMVHEMKARLKERVSELFQDGRLKRKENDPGLPEMLAEWPRKQRPLAIPSNAACKCSAEENPLAYPSIGYST